MRSFAVVLLLGSVLLAAPVRAEASCQPTSTAAALEDARTVFVGKVATASDATRIANMRVISVWKGPDLPEYVEVWGVSVPQSPATSTDGRFVAGATYLVIPETERAPFLATGCSATQRFTNTGVVIPIAYQDAVEATTGRAPVGAAAVTVETPPLPNRTLVAGVAAAGLLTAGLGLAARRRSAQQRKADAEEFPSEPKKAEPRFRVHRLSFTGLLTRLLRPSGMKRAAREREKRKAQRT